MYRIFWVGVLEALATPHGGSVLIDSATHAALAGRVATDTVQSAVLPGSPTAVPVYALKAA